MIVLFGHRLVMKNFLLKWHPETFTIRTNKIINTDWIWKLEFLPKIENFLWVLAIDAPSMKTRLNKHLYRVPTQCVMCEMYDEDVIDLFFNCIATRNIISMTSNCYNLDMKIDVQVDCGKKNFAGLKIQIKNSYTYVLFGGLFGDKGVKLYSRNSNKMYCLSQ